MFEVFFLKWDAVQCTLDKGEESGLCRPLTPSSRLISAFVLAILLFSKSKSPLLVTGITWGAKKRTTKQRHQQQHWTTFSAANRLSPNVNECILLTCLHIFIMTQVGRIC